MFSSIVLDDGTGAPRSYLIPSHPFMKKCFIFVRGTTSCTDRHSNNKQMFVSWEEEMQELNKTTNSRMASLGFISLVVCLSVAALQIWHLKAFFERKKLL
ncbi:hypothetical protein CUMW_285990 [Citrus unshiu]|uniref:GOLD domain-containing protein n=1 Tax=Citrus unshiu TaxID=55188 RepID=A0A2H5N3B1_CITUN|nr:hypothetical protein CUMW_285990 [Citrus unshiu]